MVSDPKENGTQPAATLAPEPPLEPPACRRVSSGDRQIPVLTLLVTAPSANSAIVVVNTGIAPASQRF